MSRRFKLEDFDIDMQYFFVFQICVNCKVGFTFKFVVFISLISHLHYW